MLKNFKVSSLLDFYGNALTDKQLEAAQCYYNEDLSLSEIAYNQGITRQGVRDAIKRAEVQLFEMERKLKFSKKFSVIFEGLEKIEKSVLKIEVVNKSLSFSKDICKSVEEIKIVIRELLKD
ncbi:MAG: DNA-binding protein [Oscillospiraceae bacterium]|nr:DNA-binding protein [Oscillospiraceae bacterium]